MTMTVSPTEWTREAKVPVIVTVYVPAAAVRTVSSDVPFWLTRSLRLAGARIADGPNGETPANSVTFPVSPKLLTVIVVLRDVPATKLAVLTEVSTEKSGRTVKLNTTDLTSNPLV